MLSCLASVKRTKSRSSYAYKNLLQKGDGTITFFNDRPQYITYYVNAVFVGDRSGSMTAMGSAPPEGATQFINKYKELSEKYPDSIIHITMYTFDDRIEKPFDDYASNITPQHITTVYNSMIPRGATKLFDTALTAIEDQQKQITQFKHHMETTISKEALLLEPTISSSFTLLTDGEDNMSFGTANQLSNAIKTHETLFNTTCFFAAANQDAMFAGDNYGFSRDNSLQIGNNIEQARAAFDSCTNAAIRSATQDNSAYTQAEREFSSNINQHHSDEQEAEFDDYQVVAQRC